MDDVRCRNWNEGIDMKESTWMNYIEWIDMSELTWMNHERIDMNELKRKNRINQNEGIEINVLSCVEMNELKRINWSEWEKLMNWHGWIDMNELNRMNWNE